MDSVNIGTGGGDYAEGGIDSRRGSFVGGDSTTVGLTPTDLADVLKRLVDNAHHERLRRDADEEGRYQRQRELDAQFAHIASALERIVVAQESLTRIVWILVIGSGGLTALLLVGVIVGLAVVVWRMG